MTGQRGNGGFHCGFLLNLLTTRAHGNRGEKTENHSNTATSYHTCHVSFATSWGPINLPQMKEFFKVYFIMFTKSCTYPDTHSKRRWSNTCEPICPRWKLFCTNRFTMRASLRWKLFVFPAVGFVHEQWCILCEGGFSFLPFFTSLTPF